MTNSLTNDLASKFAAIALSHVEREYPNAPQYVLSDASELKTPREAHPVFYGSFDWHSCVHGYWLLARLLRRFPGIAQAGDIRALFDRQLTAEKMAGEVAYLERPLARGFERPYGWAWALMLAAELAQHQARDAAKWSAAMNPLADAFAQRFRAFLPIATYPVRVGVHSNTAFGLLLALEYCAVARDDALAKLCRDKAMVWYGDDRDGQAWEPSQDEFHSPTLIEAACMQAVMTGPDFRVWFARFLPRLAKGEPATLFAPATVSDRTDGKIAHLDGLNLSRAWCWRRIARAFPTGDPVRARAEDTARRHVAAALPHVAGNYMGEHWLATYALLALDC